MDEKAKNDYCREIIGAGVTMSGHEYLERYSHGNLGETTPEVAQAHIEAAYSLGSPNVLICEIEEVDSTVATSDHLLVELPKDPEIRAKIFSFCARIETMSGCDPDEDVGQAYCYVWYD